LEHSIETPLVWPNGVFRFGRWKMTAIVMASIFAHSLTDVPLARRLCPQAMQEAKA
jgi:hypothetical protein